MTNHYIKFVFFLALFIEGINTDAFNKYGFKNEPVQSIHARARDEDGSCVLPLPPLHGNYVIGDLKKVISSNSLVDQFTRIDFSCSPNFVIHGAARSYCIEGKWTPDPPTCFQTCKPLKSSSMEYECSLNEVSIPCTIPMLPGTKADVQCKENYKALAFRQDTITCNNDGEWQESYVICSPECGTVDNDEAIPWHTTIYERVGTDTKKICSGSIVNANTILTAAHCLCNETSVKNKNAFVVSINSFDKYANTIDATNSFRKIKEIIVHPGYFAEDSNQQYDIALIVLVNIIEFTPAVKPVCVDWGHKGDGDNIYLGKIVQMTWWASALGDRRRNSPMQQLQLRVVSRSECRDALPREVKPFITRDKFCAAYINKSADNIESFGDGGGVLFSQNMWHGAVFYIEGIVSLRTNNSLIASTTVVKYLNFLKNNNVHKNVETFECQSGDLINFKDICDGIFDCDDYSDETNEVCQPVSTSETPTELLDSSTHTESKIPLQISKPISTKMSSVYVRPSMTSTPLESSKTSGFVKPSQTYESSSTIKPILVLKPSESDMLLITSKPIATSESMNEVTTQSSVAKKPSADLSHPSEIKISLQAIPTVATSELMKPAENLSLSEYDIPLQVFKPTATNRTSESVNDLETSTPSEFINPSENSGSLGTATLPPMFTLETVKPPQILNRVESIEDLDIDAQAQPLDYDDDEPSKDVVTCVPPPPLKNGRYKIHSDSSWRKNRVDYTCEFPYVLVGERSSWCPDGKWVHEPPLCLSEVRTGDEALIPVDCSEVNSKVSDVYQIWPKLTDKPFSVYCDFDYLNSKWTVLQKRFDGSVNFRRSFKEYIDGFGDLKGEHWLGLLNIYKITKQKDYELYILLTDFDNRTSFARFETFYMDDIKQYDDIFGKGVYMGTAGNGFGSIIGAVFCTYDRHLDSYKASEVCLEETDHGWWKYSNIVGPYSNLNGPYVNETFARNTTGVTWGPWHQNYSLKSTQIMVRRLSDNFNVAGALNNIYPEDCGQVDGRVSGVFIIQPPGAPQAFNVYCDISDNTKWTVIQNRVEVEALGYFGENYKRSQIGHGDLNGSYWLGLERIYQLTKNGGYELLIQLTDNDNATRLARYGDFSVSSVDDGYRLSVSQYRGTAGDSFTVHNGMQFSTLDHDADMYSGSCAQEYGGSWWYNNCYSSDLNGGTIIWSSWHGFDYALFASRMSIRKKSA